jgi:hypothetical protein
MKPNKQVMITEMIAAMDFGEDRAAVMATLGVKWQLAQRTFDRYWAEARTRFEASMEEEKKAFEGVRLEAKVLAFKSQIMGKLERMEILSQIARGEIPLTKPMVVGGGMYSQIELVPVVPSWQDRKVAIAELNKMDGEYAPIRKDITTGGEQLPAPVFNIILDDGEL